MLSIFQATSAASACAVMTCPDFTILASVQGHSKMLPTLCSVALFSTVTMADEPPSSATVLCRSWIYWAPACLMPGIKQSAKLRHTWSHAWPLRPSLSCRACTRQGELKHSPALQSCIPSVHRQLDYAYCSHHVELFCMPLFCLEHALRLWGNGTFFAC